MHSYTQTHIQTGGESRYGRLGTLVMGDDWERRGSKAPEIREEVETLVIRWWWW